MSLTDALALSSEQATGSLLTHLECATCHERDEADRLRNACACGGPLLARYDLTAARASLSTQALAKRPANLWRYHELLPVRSPKHIVSLGEGYTPLFGLPRLAQSCGLGCVYWKDESSNPGGTFKARGASVGLSRALELGAQRVAIASNGNAGEAWALYGARSGVPISIVMAGDAACASEKLFAVTGARAYRVAGYISNAARTIERDLTHAGWFNASTFREPYRLEGKKTIAFEIAEQLDWSLPDVIVAPAGGGITIAAIYKALLELAALGWVSGPLPRLIAVQARECAPLEAAFKARRRTCERIDHPRTFANGLRVPVTAGDFLALDAIYASGGHVLSVTDAEIREAQVRACRMEGIVPCAEAAAALAGLRAAASERLLRSDETVVVIGTGGAKVNTNWIDAAETRAMRA
jgi:threonine synthase